MNGGICVQGDRLLFGLGLVRGTVFEADLLGQVRRMVEFGSATEASSVGGLELDSSGRLYVADPMQQQLRVFTRDFVEVGSLGEVRADYLVEGLQTVDRDGVLEDPNDVAVDADGDVYVACGEQFMIHGVQKFSSQGQHLGTFPSLGDPRGVFGGPRGLVVDPDGTLVVCDTLHHRLQRFARDGRFLEVLGPPAGQALVAPHSVAVLPSGDLLVAQGTGLVVLGREDGSLRPFSRRPTERVCDVCRSGDQVWTLERDFLEFGVRVASFDLAGNLLSVPVGTLEDLVGKASTWLKAEMGRTLPEPFAWHRLGTLHHYVLPEGPATLEAAEGYYRQALKADPEGFECRLDLAEVLVKQDRLEEPRGLYLQCLDMRPEDESVRLRLAILLCRTGHKDQAREVLVAGLDRCPDSEVLQGELDRLS